MSSFVLAITDIARKGEKAYAFLITSQWLSAALEDTELSAPEVPEGTSEGEASGTLELTARKMGDDILVDGRAQATLVVPCARCNDPIDWPVDVAITQLFVPRGAYEEQHELEEIELTPQDLERETYLGDEIAVDDLVRENLILEIPMTPRCPDGCSDPAVAAILDREPEPEKKPLAGLLDLKEKLAAEEAKKTGGDDDDEEKP